MLSDCPLKFDSISLFISFFFASRFFISLAKDSFFTRRSSKILLEISSKDILDFLFEEEAFLFGIVFLLLISLASPLVSD